MWTSVTISIEDYRYLNGLLNVLQHDPLGLTMLRDFVHEPSVLSIELTPTEYKVLFSPYTLRMLCVIDHRFEAFKGIHGGMPDLTSSNYTVLFGDIKNIPPSVTTLSPLTSVQAT